MKKTFAIVAAASLVCGLQEIQAQGTAFTYQGRLAEGLNPANGQYEIICRLFNAATNGLPLGNALTNNVSVANGLFTAGLDFGPGVFDGGARWLEIGVRTNGSVNPFIILSPRQAVTSVPYAMWAATVPWTNLSAIPAGTGLIVGPGNTFGVNFAGNGASPTVSRSDHNHFGQTWLGASAVGLNITNTGIDAAGVVAQVVATNGFGILGRQGNGSGYLARPGGVAGEGDNQPGITASSRSAQALFADSYENDAVVGWSHGTTSNTFSGVAGIAESPIGQGVYGRNNATTGLNAGVFGESFSTSGTGVWGYAPATNGNADGVYGESLSDIGHGVFGVAAALTGTNAGVYGVTHSPAGRAVRGTATAASGNPYGVYGEATNSATGVGVFGGGGRIGVQGMSQVAGGAGVLGQSEYGVFGTSTNVNGTGVLGEASNGADAYGIWGVSTSGYAGYFQGKLHVEGTLTKQAGSFRIDHPLDPTNKWLFHSFVESPDMKNIYDGVTRLDERGEAIVTLPDWFSALNQDYRYQLTAMGGPAPNLHVADEIQNNQFRIAGGPPGRKVSWQITGIRYDAFAVAHRLPVEQEKTPTEKAATR